MIKSKISKKDVKDSLSFTQKIIDLHGPRLAGSDACKKSADSIHKEMEKHCDTSGIEEFDFHPDAFLGFVKVAVVLYIISTVFLFFSFKIPAIIGHTLAQFIVLGQFVFYLKILDPFYKKKKGSNVYGVIEPEGEVKQQIIISGHHDSAYVFNYFIYLPRLYRIRTFLGFLPMALIFFSVWIWGIIDYVYGPVPLFENILRYGSIVSLLFVGQLFFFIGKEGTPGAGDNLIASAMALKTAENYSRSKNKGKSLLKNTRLIFISFDAEESGLRGSRAYAKKHREELQSIPSFNLNIESIYDVNKLKFLVSDLNGLKILSKKLAKECLEISHKLGYKAKTFHFLFGAGATDAAEMAKAGVEATTIIAMPMSVEKDTVVYHTPKDTVENIDPDAVEAVLKIVDVYITEKDKSISG